VSDLAPSGTRPPLLSLTGWQEEVYYCNDGTGYARYYDLALRKTLRVLRNP